jgi:hypothetical protein
METCGLADSKSRREQLFWDELTSDGRHSRLVSARKNGEAGADNELLEPLRV